MQDLAKFDSELVEKLRAYKRQPTTLAQSQRLSINLANRLVGFRLDYYLASGKLPRSRKLIDSGLLVDEIVGPPSLAASRKRSRSPRWNSAGARDALVAFLASCPSPSRNKLKKRDRSLYDFLVRYESEELARLFPVTSLRGTRRISDAAQFDRDFAQKMRLYTLSLHDGAIRRNLSVNLANRVAGFRLDWYLARGLLPLTRALISTLPPSDLEPTSRALPGRPIESVDDPQSRRDEALASA